jgi:uncharacterized SAM-binding protein YcdF (DUF218 family)
MEWRFASAMNRAGGFKPPLRVMASRRKPLRFSNTSNRQDHANEQLGNPPIDTPPLPPVQKSSNRKTFLVPRKHRCILGFLITALALLLALVSWTWWGHWPAAVACGEVTDPAIVVVLGGGDGARAREAARLAEAFSDVPVLVTGDSGFLAAHLEASGIRPPRLQIEHDATSTWENALFSKPWVDAAGDGQMVIVTNDFHGPRSMAVFRKVYPQHDIVLSCETTAKPYNTWQEGFRRRERAAAVFYLVRYGVWSW